MPIQRYPSAKLGNYSLLGSIDIDWQLRSGTKPYITYVDIDKVSGHALLNGPIEPLTLELGTDDPIQFQKILVLNQTSGEYPSGDGLSNTSVKRLVIADQRWLWDRHRVIRHYNTQRKIGVKALFNPSQLGAVNTADAVGYVKCTLKKPSANSDQATKWKATEIIEDLYKSFKNFCTANGFAGCIAEKIDTSAVGDADKIPIENLDLDFNFDDAIDRVMNYLPGFGITVDPNGAVRVYSKTSGLDKNISDPISGHEIIGQGTIIDGNFKRLLPSKVDVFFTKEIEIRHDSEELAPGATSDRGQIEETSSTMVNVLPNPDWKYSITVSTNRGDVEDRSNVRSQGAWLEINEALYSNWGEGPGGQKLTATYVNRNMCPYMDFWAPFLLNARRQPNADWAGRIGALTANWRRTYRLSKGLVDASLSIKPYRIAVLDTVHGSRAPSMVYTDWCRIGSQKTLFRDIHNGESDGSFAVNVIGWAASLNSGVHPAPAFVRVIDEEQGIIQYDFQGDQFRNYEMTLPSMVEISGQNTAAGKLPETPGPTADLTDHGRCIGWDVVSDINLYPTMTSNHKSSVVLTHIPIGPNNNHQLYKYTVNHADLIHHLPGDVYTKTKDGLGPPVQLRVGTNLCTARYAWTDDQKDAILNNFVKAETSVDGPTNVFDSSPLDANLINLGSAAQEDQGPSIRDMAISVAASVFCEFVDRPIGQGATVFGPTTAQAKIQGYLDYVSFKLNQQGITTMSVGLPEMLPRPDPMQFMPSTLLRAIQHSVDGTR